MVKRRDEVSSPSRLLAGKRGCPPWRYVDTPEALQSAIKSLDRCSIIAFDTETTGTHPIDDSIVMLSLTGNTTDEVFEVCPISGQRYPKPVNVVYGIPVGFTGTKNILRATLVEALRYLFGSEDRIYCSHNASFDRHMLMNLGVSIKGKIWDSLYCCFLTKKTDLELIGLKEQMRRRLGIPHRELYKDLELPSTAMQRLAEMDPLLVGTYCTADAFGHLGVMRDVRKELKGLSRDGTDKSMWSLAEVGFRFLDVLWRIERRGFLIDRKVLAEKVLLAESDLLKVEKRIYRLAAKKGGARFGNPDQFNLDSPKQLNELFDAALTPTQRALLPCTDVWRCTAVKEETVQLKTKTKVVSKRCKGTARNMKKTWDSRSKVFCPECGERILPVRSSDKGALETLADEGVKIAELIRDRNKIAHLLTSFLRPMGERLSQSTKRVHTRFSAIKRTTRLSSSAPNLQNIPGTENDPYHLREVFIARPGCGIIVADYSQLELRGVTHFSREDLLLRAFQRGEDPHGATAVKMFKLSSSKFFALIADAKKKGKTGEPLTTEESVALRQRHAAKTLNFAILYGAGPRRLARVIGVDVETCMKYYREWQRANPRIMDLKTACIEIGRKTGFITTIMGHRRPVGPYIFSKDPEQRGYGERITLNTLVQGSAANIVMMAMIALEKARADGKISAEMILQVHDELVFECPEDRIEHDMPIIKKIMEHPFAEELAVPLVVEPASGPSWGVAKRG